ncbi:MAG: AmmeMemoRadiSam system radical SAM enzyme [Pseudomonadota bacterium]|nr:AmmeMemoRadiSam system radical SAM enzyme [Pseudomonadota bacterium]
MAYRLVPTRLQESIGDGSVRCNLCLWRCRLRHGQRGFCQAHVNRDGTLYNLSYGIISAMDVSGIEEKPVHHFRPGSRVLSIGSYGCSFRCGGCHNLEISWGEAALDALARGESRAAFAEPDELVSVAVAAGVDGIAFTYSEPAVWLEYVIDVCDAAKAAGLFTVYVSNSFVSYESLDLLAGRVDVLCSDIKSMDDAFYKSICGKARVEHILSAVRHAHRLGIHVETRTNVIPGLNDEPANLTAIARWIHDHLGADSPWHITRFFPAYRLAHVPATTPETLYRARDMAVSEGLTRVYVHGDKGCDCAAENLPVDAYLGNPALLYNQNQCPAACCGDEGILLKKYEHKTVQQVPLSNPR